LVMARTAAQARNYLVFGGAIYLVLFVYGLIVGHESAANFVPVNTADDFLHLVLGIGMVGLGLVLTRDRRGIAGATS
jgi:formate-dependent nitrite reductase membrane component NrfD